MFTSVAVTFLICLIVTTLLWFLVSLFLFVFGLYRILGVVQVFSINFGYSRLIEEEERWLISSSAWISLLHFRWTHNCLGLFAVSLGVEIWVGQTWAGRNSSFPHRRLRATLCQSGRFCWFIDSTIQLLLLEVRLLDSQLRVDSLWSVNAKLFSQVNIVVRECNLEDGDQSWNSFGRNDIKCPEVECHID